MDRENAPQIPLASRKFASCFRQNQLMTHRESWFSSSTQVDYHDRSVTELEIMQAFLYDTEHGNPVDTTFMAAYIRNPKVPPPPNTSAAAAAATSRRPPPIIASSCGHYLLTHHPSPHNLPCPRLMEERHCLIARKPAFPCGAAASPWPPRRSTTPETSNRSRVRLSNPHARDAPPQPRRPQPFRSAAR